jgi:hypothetical protein
MREKRLLASSRLSVCLSVHMEQFGPHCTDFHEIWYLSIFRKSRESSSFIKMWKAQSMETDVQLRLYLSELL